MKLIKRVSLLLGLSFSLILPVAHSDIRALSLLATQLQNSGDDKTALVIIDMQPVFVTRGGKNKSGSNPDKVKKILEVHLAAIKLAKKQKMPIVVLEYEGEGDTTEALKKEIKNYDQKAIILKDTDGAFDNQNKHKKELTDWLTQNHVKTLIITGANGGACVYQTISGALHDHYNVIADLDGIADFNYADFIYPYIGQYHFKPASEEGKYSEVNEMASAFISGALKGKNQKDKPISKSPPERTNSDKPKAPAGKAGK